MLKIKSKYSSPAEARTNISGQGQLTPRRRRLGVTAVNSGRLIDLTPAADGQLYPINTNFVLDRYVCQITDQTVVQCGQW